MVTVYWDGYIESAFQGKTIAMYEYFLIGSVLDQYKDGLIEILRGLCDNSDCRPIEFNESEYIYSFVMPNASAVSLRTRCARSFQDNKQFGNWHLRYIGQIDQKESSSKQSMIRTYLDCITNSNINDYLQALGFTLDSEVIVKGNMFHKGRLKIIVSKLFGISQTGEPQPITSSHLVEVTSIAMAGQDIIANEIKAFSDLLRPYVRMDKMHTIAEQIEVHQ